MYVEVYGPAAYQPFFTSIAFLKCVLETHREYLEWSDPPYEYEYEKKPIDLILGNSSLRKDLEYGENPSFLRDSWTPDLKSFSNWRTPFLLYQ